MKRSKVGELDKNVESRKVVKPEFAADFLEAVVREGRDVLTLRADEEGALRTLIDTTNVGDIRWRPPLVDEDRHAICQAIFHGVEGSEWDAMYYRCKEPHTVVECKKIRKKTIRPRHLGL